MGDPAAREIRFGEDEFEDAPNCSGLRRFRGREIDTLQASAGARSVCRSIHLSNAPRPSLGFAQGFNVGEAARFRYQLFCGGKGEGVENWPRRRRVRCMDRRRTCHPPTPAACRFPTPKTAQPGTMGPSRTRLHRTRIFPGRAGSHRGELQCTDSYYRRKYSTRAASRRRPPSHFDEVCRVGPFIGLIPELPRTLPEGFRPGHFSHVNR